MTVRGVMSGLRPAVRGGLASIVLVGGALGALAASHSASAQTAPAQTPPEILPARGAFAGLPPRGAGIAMLIATDSTTAPGLTGSLTDAGCQVESIAVLRPKSVGPGPLPVDAPAEWSGYVAGAPAAVNDPFVRLLPTIPANTPFFVRCRAATQPAVDPANARYLLGGTIVTLLNGRSDVPAAPGSATRMVTQLTDRQAFGEVDSALAADAAVVLVHQPGGSGSFYYLAMQSGGAPGTTVGPTVLLGDRVSVEGVSIARGRIVVTYLDHGLAEPLAFPPTQPVTKVFVVRDGQLVEVGSLRG